MQIILKTILLSLIIFCPLLAEVEYLICRTCGYKENTQADRYCQECGSPLADKITCPFCKQKNHDGDEYCMNCLKPLKGKTFLDQVRSVKEKVIQEEKDEKILQVSAETLDERAWAERTSDILIALKNYDFKNAIKFGGKALAKAKKTFGSDHPKTADSLSILAYVHLQAKNYGHAADLFLESINLLEKIFGKKDEKLLPEKLLLLQSLIGKKDKEAAGNLLETIKETDKLKDRLSSLKKEFAKLPEKITQREPEPAKK